MLAKVFVHLFYAKNMHKEVAEIVSHQIILQKSKIWIKGHYNDHIYNCENNFKGLPYICNFQNLFIFLSFLQIQNNFFSPSPGEWTRLGLDALDSGGNWFEYKSRLFDNVSIITTFYYKTIEPTSNDKTFKYFQHLRNVFEAIFVRFLKTIYSFSLSVFKHFLNNFRKLLHFVFW